MSLIKQTEEIDMRLKCPFSMIVCGPSNCGKTTWVVNLLRKHSDLFNQKNEEIVWFYKVWQDAYIQNSDIITRFEQGMCTMDWLEKNVKPYSTIVIDDMASEASEDTAKIFTVGSHHFKLNIIFITQNLFPKNKAFRDISLNATYLTLFKNINDKLQISTFASRYSPGNKKNFMNIYNAATKAPHSYLLLDNHQKTVDAYRIISNYLNEDNKPISLWLIDSK
jgi:hypothetical protein